MKLSRRQFLKAGGVAAATLAIPVPLRAQQGPRIPVLRYHDISETRNDRFTVRPAAFAAQMEWLYGNGFKAVPLRQALQLGPGERALVITFDDGHTSYLDYAYYRLREYGFWSIVNLVGKLVGGSLEKDSYRPLLSWDECRFLISGGLVELGAHSYQYHSPDNRLQVGMGELEDDLFLFQEIMRSETGKRAEILAWPAQYSPEDETTMARKAGIGYVLTDVADYYRDSLSTFAVPRFTIDESTTMSQFRRIMEGA